MMEEWRDSAACYGKAPLWDTTIDDGGPGKETEAARQERRRQAREICKGCTVSEECRAAAIPGVDEGMRAGRMLVPLNSRKNQRERMGPGMYSEAPHGSQGAARAHSRRGEPLCDICAVENRARNKAKREKAAS